MVGDSEGLGQVNANHDSGQARAAQRADRLKSRGAELDPFEDVLFGIGAVFLTEEAVVRASRHDLWLFTLSLAAEPITIWHDIVRCGWHIRLKPLKAITA